MTNTNLLFEQSEKVRPLLPNWFGRWKVVSNFIQKGEVEMVSERDFRIPFKTQPGGRVGTYNPNFGAIGRGTRMQGDVMISTFYPLRLAFELAQLDIDATAKSEQAVKSAFKEAMADAMPEFANYVDKFFHSDGTARLGTATATTSINTGTQTQYTMDQVFGVQRLRRGMYVNVYDSTFTTLKSSSTVYIKSIDWENKNINLSGLVPGAANTDILTFEGVSGANPIGLKGLYYYNNFATSGTTLGVDRSLEPEIIANKVNGSGGLTHTLGLNLLHKILNRRGELAKNLIGFAAPAQQAAVFALINNTSMQRYDVGGGVKAVDLLPEVDLKFKFAGVTHYVDIHQDMTRLDWINPKLWGRARLHPVKFFEIDGRRFHPIYGGDGSPAAGLWFAMIMNEDFYCSDPGSQGVISGLTVPANY